MTRVLIALFILAIPVPGFAQIDGSVSLMLDVLPDVSGATGSQDVSELRARVFAERTQDLGERLRIYASAYVDGLFARRVDAEGTVPGAAPARRRIGDAIARPGEVYVDVVSSRFDLRAGMARVVWGRLDELQPTDVVNPVDLTRFLLEGRSEARLPVALVRGRLFLPGASTIEALVVPVFRRSEFDQLDEESSPFNIAGTGTALDRREPAVSWQNLQGGGRFTTTIGRVDFGLSGFHGFRSFPVIAAPPSSFLPVQTHPRFTTVGADFETVRGAWGVRGEIAVTPRDVLQSTRAVTGVPGHAVEAGIGVDRRTGNYRVAGNVLWSRRGVDASDAAARPFAGDDELQRSDVSVVASVDRSFARETRTTRILGVYDPVDRTVFARMILNVSLRDNLSLEGSAGVFAGSSLDTIGRLTGRDFFYLRLKTFF